MIDHLIQAWPDSIRIPCQYMYKYEIDESDGDDQDSDMEHLGYDINGEEFDANNDDTNDESNMNKPMQCFGLPVDLICQWEQKPSLQIICLLTNQMPPLHFVCTYAAKIWGPQTMIVYLSRGCHAVLSWHAAHSLHVSCRCNMVFIEVLDGEMLGGY